MKLGVKEAADTIREEVERDRMSHMDPEQAHAVRYVKSVCEQLSLEPNVENVHHVMSILRRNDIEPPSGDEFPKYVERKWDRSLHIVHDDEEADAKINEPEPDPTALNKPRVADEPVQDTGLDLSNRVPHVVKPGGKAPTDPLPHPDLADATTGAAKVQGGVDLGSDAQQHDDDEDSIEVGGDNDDEVVLADNEPVHDQPAAEPAPMEAPPAPKQRRRPM